MYNYKMFELIIEAISQDKKLENKLNSILKKGFLIKSDCVFLNFFFNKSKNIKKEDFIDKTGYECFINSFHIDDFIKEDLLIQAMIFIRELIIEWRKLKNDHILKIILSQTDYGYNLRFHLFRENENWIDEENLDEFTEAILIVNSSNLCC